MRGAGTPARSPRCWAIRKLACSSGKWGFPDGTEQVLCAFGMRLPQPKVCKDPGFGDGQDGATSAFCRLNTHGYVAIDSGVAPAKLESLVGALLDYPDFGPGFKWHSIFQRAPKGNQKKTLVTRSGRKWC